MGPFSSQPFDLFRCSPIGVVPKRTPGEFRLIHHLSSPRGSSINDNIDPRECTVSYTSFDDAVALVVSLGKNAHIVGDTAKWHTPTFRVRMIFRDNRV